MVLVTAVAVGSWALHQPSIVSSDVIVLADLENQTTEPVLTGTLKQALAVKLSESHFINLLSDERVRETLRMMQRNPDETLTFPLARDVCQRVGANATLSGAISAIGSSYVISFNATSCSNGETLAREQAQAARREEILPALDSMTVRLRRQLGESLLGINAANTSLERATTPSLDALKAYTEGEARFLSRPLLESIPFYKRAIELDPDFAMAHAKLGVAYGNAGIPGAVPELTRAYELRDRLTEREQFYVTTHYHQLGRGDLEASRTGYEVWKASYPLDPVPYNQLGLIHVRQGNFDRALAEFERAARVTPTGFAYSNLFAMYLHMDRIADAKNLLNQGNASMAGRDLTRSSLSPFSNGIWRRSRFTQRRCGVTIPRTTTQT